MQAGEPNRMELQDYLSLTFTTDQKVRLVPFLASLTLYVILYLPVLGYPPETLGSVFCKVLPIWCLALYVSMTANDFSLHKLPVLDKIIPEDDYARHFFFGLLLSSFGDACLVWRQVLFVPGVFFFGLAHVMYFTGIKLNNSESRTRSIFVLLGISIFLCIQSGINSYFMKFIVALYICLIFCVGWKATARFEASGSKAAAAGCIGALLFIFSDFIIAIDKWYVHVPFAECMIMTTYYAAQFGLALSTTKDLN